MRTSDTLRSERRHQCKVGAAMALHPGRPQGSSHVSHAATTPIDGPGSIVLLSMPSSLRDEPRYPRLSATL